MYANEALAVDSMVCAMHARAADGRAVQYDRAGMPEYAETERRLAEECRHAIERNARSLIRNLFPSGC